MIHPLYLSRGASRPGLGMVATSVLLLILGLRILLGGLAAASPTDPTWIAGFWDAGDSDEIVVGVGLIVEFSESSAPLRPPRPESIRLLPPTALTLPRVSRLVPQDRGPPLL